MRHLLSTVLVLVACNCRTVTEPDTPSPDGVDALARRIDQVAHVDACDVTGSGVILPNGRVITALHVVLGCANYKVTAVVSEKESAGALEIAHADDFARLVLADPLPSQPVTVATVEPGDVVCLLAGSPFLMARCGVVLEANPGKGGIKHSIPTVKGNSGGGVYNDRGDLVGIVVTCNLRPDGACDDDGGGATAVPAWLVE